MLHSTEIKPYYIYIFIDGQFNQQSLNSSGSLRDKDVNHDKELVKLCN